MKLNSEKVILISFLSFVIGIIIIMSYDHRKSKERSELRRTFMEKTFSDFYLNGKVIETRTTGTGGRPIDIFCIEVISSSHDTLFIFDKDLNIAFKLEGNLAVMSGGAGNPIESIRVVDVNVFKPGKITRFDKDGNILFQSSTFASFSSAFLVKSDLQICDDLIN